MSAHIPKEVIDLAVAVCIMLIGAVLVITGLSL